METQLGRSTPPKRRLLAEPCLSPRRRNISSRDVLTIGTCGHGIGLGPESASRTIVTPCACALAITIRLADALLSVIWCWTATFAMIELPLHRCGHRASSSHSSTSARRYITRLPSLNDVGARPDQVVRSVIYVVSDDNSVLAAAWRQLTLSVIGSAFTTASTLLGVTRLGFSGQLVEVDLTAAL